MEEERDWVGVIIRRGGVSEKSASVAPTAGQALEVKVGGGRCVSCHKSVRGRLPVRGPHQNPTWGRDGCVLFSMEGVHSRFQSFPRGHEKGS